MIPGESGVLVCRNLPAEPPAPPERWPSSATNHKRASLCNRTKLKSDALAVRHRAAFSLTEAIVQFLLNLPMLWLAERVRGFSDSQSLSGIARGGCMFIFRAGDTAGSWRKLANCSNSVEMFTYPIHIIFILSQIRINGTMSVAHCCSCSCLLYY